MSFPIKKIESKFGQPFRICDFNLDRFFKFQKVKLTVNNNIKKFVYILTFDSKYRLYEME